ncbi:MAG: hypothetical protein Q8S33_09690 [Myxococcales bacterium]|nr:hypothetical protein [Myxococcales bacterium]
MLVACQGPIQVVSPKKLVLDPPPTHKDGPRDDAKARYDAVEQCLRAVAIEWDLSLEAEPGDGARTAEGWRSQSPSTSSLGVRLRYPGHGQLGTDGHGIFELQATLMRRPASGFGASVRWFERVEPRHRPRVEISWQREGEGSQEPSTSARFVFMDAPTGSRVLTSPDSLSAQLALEADRRLENAQDQTQVECSREDWGSKPRCGVVKRPPKPNPELARATDDYKRVVHASRQQLFDAVTSLSAPLRCLGFSDEELRAR